MWGKRLLVIPFLLIALVLASPVLGLILAIVLWFDSKKIELRKYDSALSYSPTVLAILAFLFWPVVLPWYLDVRSALRRGELQLKQAEPKGTGIELAIRVICILALGTGPYLAYFLGYIISPAIYVPFFNEPISRIVFIGFIWLQWQSFLLLLNSRTLIGWLSYGLGSLLPQLVLLNVGPWIVIAKQLLLAPFDSDQMISAPEAEYITAGIVAMMKEAPLSTVVFEIAIPVILIMLVLTFPGIWIKVLLRPKRA